MADAKVKVQKFGNKLSAMVMPNIGAFIAWGILAALFIPAGYFPNERLNELVGPTLKYILPVLIGYTAGSNLYGRRGGVAGAIATVGVVIGSDVTMLVGGMFMGPLGAWLIKKFDEAMEGKVRPGLEMMIDNFSLGIIGAVTMVVGYLAVAPIYKVISDFLMGCVTWAMNHNVMQLSPIFVVPGQLLFLNNAINHGIFSPLGLQQAAETGKSILFLVESSGGAWTGLAIAFALFGRGQAKKSAPSVVVIQGIGGIGETVFPYALIKPATMLGPIIGQIVALYWFTFFGGGTIGPVSPGSFPALILMSPKDALFANVSGYIVSMFVSVAIVGFILKRDKTPDEEEMAAAPASEPQRSDRTPAAAGGNDALPFQKKNIEKIYFACDAGMGSSVMAASILTTQLNKVGMGIKVKHTSITNVPADADVVVVNEILYERAASQVAEGVPILKVKDLSSREEFAAVARSIRDMAE